VHGKVAQSAARVGESDLDVVDPTRGPRPAQVGQQRVAGLLAAFGHDLHPSVEQVLRTADQSELPDKPLVVGPGYTPNPENDITKKP